MLYGIGSQGLPGCAGDQKTVGVPLDAKPRQSRYYSCHRSFVAGAMKFLHEPGINNYKYQNSISPCYFFKQPGHSLPQGLYHLNPFFIFFHFPDIPADADPSPDNDHLPGQEKVVHGIKGMYSPGPA